MIETSMKDVDREVRRAFAMCLGINENNLNYEQHIYRDLGADSLDAVELVMELEEAFEIELPDEDWEKCCTVGDVIRMLEAHVKHGGR